MIRTLEQFHDALASDMAWRKRELTVIRFLVQGAKHEARAALIRAGVAILYAHWEGFIKTGATTYLQFVSGQRLRYRELATPLLAVAARRILQDATVANRISRHIDVTEFFVSKLNQTCVLPERAVRTKANVSSSVLKDIVTMLGLDYSVFATKEALIDESLVERRNGIAHGEYLPVDVAAYEELSSEIVALLELFWNQVDNAAALRAYRRAS
jgi:hypothetical protein